VVSGRNFDIIGTLVWKFVENSQYFSKMTGNNLGKTNFYPKPVFDKILSVLKIF